MIKKLPIWLVYSRVVAGLLILLLAWLGAEWSRGVIVALMVYGLISDFFDGYIARRVGVSAERLRRLDSTVDQFFWLAVMLGSYWLSPQFYKDHWLSITLLIGLEAAAYVISFVRFKKEVATHALASKLWVLTLLFTFVEVVLRGNSSWVFTICFWVGVVSRLEIIAILLLIKKWVNDVPTIYHAIQLRQGKTIKRNKIFNG
ncbi:MAG: CDP-alcohol phosphatidyltransferase family protein [Flavipsychrobacter sp.]